MNKQLIIGLFLLLAACGGGGGSAAPTPTPTPVDNTPVAVDDSFTIDQDTALNADISTNDSGLEDTPVTYSLDSAATNGAASVNADGTATATCLHSPIRRSQ